MISQELFIQKTPEIMRAVCQWLPKKTDFRRNSSVSHFLSFRLLNSGQGRCARHNPRSSMETGLAATVEKG